MGGSCFRFPHQSSAAVRGSSMACKTADNANSNMKSLLNSDDVEKTLQFSVKATGNALALALFGVLLVAWVVSEPVFQLRDHLTRRAKEKVNREKPKGRGFGDGIGRTTLLAVIGTATMIPSRTVQAQSQVPSMDSATIAAPISKPATESIWENGIGEGFKDGDQSLSLSFGGTDGIRIFGGRDRHDLELNSIAYGYMLGAVEGEGHWYRGNWEVRGELFGGVQFSPSGNWVVGLTPHLRYNFATGTRWIPFLDLGAGVSATGIGAPDLSGTFEFNLQANTGVRWFIRDNLALTFEAGYLHFSDAGISKPNQGINSIKGMIGVSWFF